MNKLTPSIVDALDACQKPAENAFSLPPDCYVDETITNREIKNLFRTSWFGVGRADVVANPGDYITLDIADQTIMLVRGRDSMLRAFANTCRHRSARLLEGKGECRGIRCPFHSWAYKLDGSLVAAPHMDDAEGFNRDDYGLIQYRADEREGFAFVCINSGAPDLDEVLGDFSKIHADWPLASLRSTRRRELTVDCNWKSFLEVFNEYYHLPFVHPDSIDDVYDKPEAATKTTGQFVSQFGRTVGTGGLLQTEQDKALPEMPGLTGEAKEGVRYTWLFPNMTFAAGRDALWVYEAYPLGPNQCQVVQTACFPPETLELPGASEKLAAYHSRLDAALAEDIPALVNQQRGFSSPDARQGRFHPLLEANVAGFAHWYATHLKADPSSDEGAT